MVKLCLKEKVQVAVLKGHHIFFVTEAEKIIGREPPKGLFSQN